ncbi:MAG: hypothetical protein WC426_14310 [Sulfuriferula sp.]
MVKTTFTRPANTTAYTAGDVVGPALAALEFVNVGNPTTDVIITDADLEIDITAVPSGMTSFRLYLYNATPPSALADNAAFDLPAGDRASFLGYIDLGTPVDLGSTLYVQTSQINRNVKLGATTSLFAYLVTVGGFTPASATVKSITLHTVAV